MKTEDFELLSGLVKERSGLVLSEDKLYLIESRLIPLARRRGLAGLDDLVSAIRSKGDEPLLVEVTALKVRFRLKDGKVHRVSFQGGLMPPKCVRDAVIGMTVSGAESAPRASHSMTLMVR